MMLMTNLTLDQWTMLTQPQNPCNFIRI